MRPVSGSFLAAVVKSHQLVVQVDVIRPGLTSGSQETLLATLATVQGGSVTLDATAQIRGRVDLTIIDDGSGALAPSHPTDLLAPYGNELHVRRGLQYADGSIEVVSLGKFRIDACTVDDGPEGLTINVTGLDRAARVIDARFEEPYDLAEGFIVTDAINDTLDAVLISLDPTLMTETLQTVPHLIAEEGSDRWQFVTDIARSAGMRLFFDGDGKLVNPPEVTGGPTIAQLAEGVGGVLLSAARQWDRTGAFNAVIATGENTGETAPARGVAIDDDASSPTYYYGPFGKVPRFYQSSFITTDAQAADAAASLLQKELGTTQRVNFGAYCNPALEPDDIVQITRARTGINESHILQAVTIPLTADGAMTGTTRATQAA